jgi:K+-transporting ATPase ATPase A chain
MPAGRWMAALAEGRLGPLRALDAALLRGCGIDPQRGQDWRAYLLAMLTLNAAGCLLLYAILRLQDVLPLNPQGFDGLSPYLAFNTAISFVTNTNWQAYSGEAAMSHFSQMAGLTVQNFLSAATGIALAFAVIRAFAAGGVRLLGNFWADMLRVTLWLLLPGALLAGIAFIAMGVPQTLAASFEATTLEGAAQTIPLGPVAFQLAIKHLGTNGGGFFGVNSAHPFEGPSALATALQIVLQVVLPFGLCLTFGRMVGDRRQGRALLSVMVGFVLLATLAIYAAEAGGNPLHLAAGVAPELGNMEGKEVRFGQALAALFTATTTGASCGAVNAMLDSFTPLGGLVPLFLIQLGEVLPGGVGSGLYGMLVFALLAVFVAGLMVGRTPEYLGKKVQAREVKLAMLAVLVLPAVILGGSAAALLLPAGVASLANAGPHGLTEMLYAYTSAAGNNGSAFGGLAADTPWLDVTLGLAMLLGRFGFVIPVLALAGSLAAKPRAPEGPGTLATHGALFVVLLASIILILGGLQYLPALALGPIAEHMAMLAGQTF